MQPEIVLADPAHRKRVWLRYVLSVVACLTILYLLLPELPGPDGDHVDEWRRYFVGSLLLVGTLGLLMCVRVARLGWRTLKSQQYPPPGVRVIKDTLVIRGEGAVRNGYGMLALAIAFIGILLGILPFVMKGLLELPS